MHELAEPTGRKALDSRGAEPRAVVHKNILDRAAADPDAPMSEIASDVPGATVGLVERVLEEYGDPGVQDDGGSPDGTDDMQGADHDATTDPGHEPMGEQQTEQTRDAQRIAVPEFETLTEKQRSTLETIREHPEATQAELADLVGVTSATVNTRVNAIDGFDWDRRREFVDRLFGDDGDEGNGAEDGDEGNQGDDRDGVTGGGAADDANPAEAGHEMNRTNEPDETDDTNDTNEVDDDESTEPNEPNRDRDTARSDGDDAENRDEPTDAVRVDSTDPSTTDARPSDSQSSESQTSNDLADRIEELTALVESVASCVEANEPTPSGAFEDPELVHKVLRACLNDDEISADDELEIVRAVVG